MSLILYQLETGNWAIHSNYDLNMLDSEAGRATKVRMGVGMKSMLPLMEPTSGSATTERKRNH